MTDEIKGAVIDEADKFDLNDLRSHSEIAEYIERCRERSELTGRPIITSVQSYRDRSSLSPFVSLVRPGANRLNPQTSTAQAEPSGNLDIETLRRGLDIARGVSRDERSQTLRDMQSRGRALLERDFIRPEVIDYANVESRVFSYLGMKFVADKNMKAGTVEIRHGDKVLGRIENIDEPNKKKPKRLLQMED